MTNPHKTDISLLSGQYFDWADIGANSHLTVTDIARGLSCVARYAGQTPGRPYTVAQHSVLVTNLLVQAYPRSPKLWLMGLFHDATEALMGDIVSPLKRLLPDYQRIENELHGHMARWFNFDPEHDPRVRHADLVALALEKRLILRNEDRWDCLEKAGIDAKTLAGLSQPPSFYLPNVWSHDEACGQFLLWYRQISSACQIPSDALPMESI